MNWPRALLLILALSVYVTVVATFGSRLMERYWRKLNDEGTP